MLYRVFGRSGSGKTKYIFEKAAECIVNKRHAFFVVPEQSAVKTETEIIKKLGNESNSFVEVINFKRLCNRVFRQTGGLAAKHLEKGADKIAMLCALDSAGDFFEEYKQSAHDTDFVKKALETVNELSASALCSKDLEKALSQLPDSPEYAATRAKISDIALIAAAYEAQNAEITGSYGDIYDKLCEKLQDSAFFADKTVFFDGFYGFTAKEIKIISYIAEDADEVYVTLPCAKDCRDEIFTRTSKAAQSLQKLAERADIQICDIELKEDFRHREGSALRLYRNGFSSDSLAANISENNTNTEKDGLEILSCRDIYSEAKAACAVVCGLVRNGAKYSDICICAKSCADYDGIIDAVFRKAGVPLGFDKPEKLTDSALYYLVCSAFDCVYTMNPDAVLNYVKTGLSGVSDVDADMFETYVRTWDIGTRQVLCDEDWNTNPLGYTDAPADKNVLDAVNRAKRTVYTCLDGFRLLLKDASTVKDYALAVWHLLGDIQRQSGKTSFDDKSGGIQLDLLCKCLDIIVNTAGEKCVNTAMFLNMFKLCAEDCDTGKIPERADCVMFSPAELVRASNVRYMILLGANDGIFPSGSHSSGLISDRERPLLAKYGLTLPDTGDSLAFDELFLAYSAVCSASERTYILFSEQTSAGERMFPSVICQSAAKLTGNGIKAFDEDDIGGAYCSDELLFEEYITMKNSPQKSAAEKYLSSKKDFASRLEFLGSNRTQSENLNSDSTKLLFDGNISTSYSRLETYNQCPFSHFCTYTLRLRPEPKAKLDAIEAGSVMHKILEQFVPMLATSKKDGRLMDVETAHGIIKELLSEYLEKITHGNTEKLSKRFKYTYMRLSRQLFALADALIEECKVSEFETAGVEVPVSDSADIKPVPINISGGVKLFINGQIDRVDTLKKGGKTYIRIVDYKTGRKQFKLDDILSGFNLQMLLYMYSICNSKNPIGGENPVPAGIMYSRVYDPDAKENSGYDDELLVSELEARAYSSGMFTDDAEILLDMDRTGSARFIPVKFKDGALAEKQPVMSAEKLGELLNFAAHTASVLASEIYSGGKKAEPYIDKNLNACTFCNMLPVCQGFKTSRNAVFQKRKFSENTN